MDKLLSKFEPHDVVAMLVTIICGVLLAMGRDHIIGYALVTVVCGYFGIRLTPLGDLISGKNGKDGTDGTTKQ